MLKKIRLKEYYKNDVGVRGRRNWFQVPMCLPGKKLVFYGGAHFNKVKLVELLIIIR